MESNLKDTQNKLRKAEKEKKFYKGTLEMVEKAGKSRADKSIPNVTEAYSKTGRVDSNTSQSGPPCVPPNVLQMSTPIQNYPNQIPVAFPAV